MLVLLQLRGVQAVRYVQSEEVQVPGRAYGIELLYGI
jgi:hypothetical protein